LERSADKHPADPTEAYAAAGQGGSVLGLMREHAVGPGRPLVRLPDSGPFWPLEAPAELAAAIVDALGTP